MCVCLSPLPLSVLSLSSGLVGVLFNDKTRLFHPAALATLLHDDCDAPAAVGSVLRAHVHMPAVAEAAAKVGALVFKCSRDWTSFLTTFLLLRRRSTTCFTTPATAQ